MTAYGVQFDHAVPETPKPLGYVQILDSRGKMADRELRP